MLFGAVKCSAQSVPSITCADEIFQVKCQWSTPVRCLSQTTSSLKQTMPLYKEASFDLCILLVIHWRHAEENIPKQLLICTHVVLSNRSRFLCVTATKSSVKLYLGLTFGPICPPARWCRHSENICEMYIYSRSEQQALLREISPSGSRLFRLDLV